MKYVNDHLLLRNFEYVLVIDIKLCEKYKIFGYVKIFLFVYDKHIVLPPKKEINIKIYTIRLCFVFKCKEKCKRNKIEEKN